MAGAGILLFTSGQQVTAAQVNTYLMDQTIQVYASTTARDNAFGGAGEPTLAEGMMCYLSDSNNVLYYTGTSWSALGENDQFVLSSQIFS